ncbi:hypothetical protein PUNSTDRAFT_145755 [Punctularia strigosozonata HHB-11173 SS5]|uniref:uncharacterized protein n=1 Tax=Punctularia strigosozonata (strain HHB-11173) TaxID=741275 RepID=UPI00044172F7|nr:uncharacterized protein PUNSTDRAFT_145755 [Punctularia strigosozonata HHB-11173 SS5]EIN05848.1 hypothetical protein PUNSTDRAFT_145755 [Punctularia strigosozonata HHB-11173 SS5]
MSASETAALEQLLGDLWSVRVASIATLAWLVYDTILMMKDEIRFIWFSKRSTTKWLYLSLRYLTLGSLATNVYVNVTAGLSTSVCKSWLWYITIGGSTLTTAMGSVVLVLRLYALYSRSRSVLLFSSALLAVNIAAILAVACVTIPSTRAVTSESELGLSMPGCFFVNEGFITLQIAPSITDSVVHAIYFFMTLRHFLTNFRQHIHHWHMAPTLHLLMRDSAAYFLALFANALFYLVFHLQYAHRELQLLGQPLVMANIAIAATRLVLNLRCEAGKSGALATEEEDDVELSKIEFEMPHSQDSRPGALRWLDSHDLSSCHEPSSSARQTQSQPGSTSPER